MNLGIGMIGLGILTLSVVFTARRTSPPGDFARWRLFTGPVMILAGMVMIAASYHII